MSQYDVEVLILCLVVFVASCAASAFVLTYVFRLETKCIVNGLFDDKIVKVATKKPKKCGKIMLVLRYGVAAIIVLAVVITFVFSLFTYITRFKKVGEVSAIKVVQSSSMERKDEQNTYLSENGLDNQIKKYDLVLVHCLPDEFELELYDVVVYKTVDGNFVIHRIVGIEEPNEQHPDQRYFTLRGDNVQYSDKRPVLYSQMIGIYRGERIGFLGKIVMFFQSYAGYMCLGLVIIYFVVMPFVDKKMESKINDRMRVLTPYDGAEGAKPSEEELRQ